MPRPTKKCKWVLWATLVVPLNHVTQEWYIPSYSNLKPNRISFGAKGLKIDVNDSSSPLFYALQKSVPIKSISMRGRISRFSEPPKTMKEGDIPDDCPLRLGLVETTPGGPSWLQRLVSPRWVKDLFELFPNQTIKKVTFLTIDPYRKVGSLRTHPKNSLIIEQVALSLKNSGPFQLDYKFKEPLTTQAIWLQSDGDDSHTRFFVELESLKLETMN
ncbi:MAG: hypothetical protein EBR01_08520 [Proteobacteria bacterium]|nr:hypothetical protein [Pseudomonadota bacterium]